MLLMKKDMGGAANVLALASMIMAAKLQVRLRVLIPAVENAISGNAFRPGDVLPSRKGITVEIGNTDAEGRLVLADALALADEEEPRAADRHGDADRRGARRARPGPAALLHATTTRSPPTRRCGARRVEDPLWRMPLWRPYDAKLSSKIADINNVTTDGFAGSITAALFLQRFVEKAAPGRISTSSPGTRPTARTARPAAKPRASARWSVLSLEALRQLKACRTAFVG